MDQSVLDILYVVLSTAGAKVSVLIEIALKIPVYCLSDGVAPNVELSVFVEKRSFAILLNNVRPLFTVNVRIADYLSDLAQFTANGYATTSVGVLARLYNPELGPHRGVLCQVRMRTRRVVSLFKFAKGTVS